MKSSDIDNIFRIFSKENPSPSTELNYTNNYTLLVAVVLSAQTTDSMVNKVTLNLFKIADNPAKMLDLGEEELKKHINKIGLFNAKAKNIIKLSRILLSNYNSDVPSDLESLISLPGVGRKTANVVLNCAFSQAVMPVDTHVQRVSNRIGFSLKKTPREVEDDLMNIIPENWLLHAHHWLILHGRYICKARNPLCGLCKIREFCYYYSQFQD